MLRQPPATGWYIYAVGEVPPEAPASESHLLKFIDEIDALLHQEHDEDYCGIVYTDSKESPNYIKIFDPNNLGVSCGFSENPLPTGLDLIQNKTGRTGSSAQSAKQPA